LCAVCEKQKAIRYSRRYKQKWCLSCYTAKYIAFGGKIGRCPLIEDWLTSVREALVKARDEVTTR
jgi:hypothetical protein